MEIAIENASIRPASVEALLAELEEHLAQAASSG